MILLFIGQLIFESEKYDKIPSVGDTIAVFCATVFAWFLVTGLTMWAVWAEACNSKRAKSAIHKDFPYFTYPFYKKIFFMGLKGALSKVNLVFVWGSVVSLILYTPTFIILIAEPCRSACVAFSGMLSVCFDFIFGRLVVLRISWPDFKGANIGKR